MEQQANVITLGEANIPLENNIMAKDYPGNNVELLEIKGHDLARLARKGLIYGRLRDIEMEDTCLIVIKI